MIDSILKHYGILDYSAETLASGLINNTWKIVSGTEAYILQRVNQNVFKKPDEVAENMQRLKLFLAKQNPDYLFVAPLTTIEGEELVNIERDGYYRLFPFVKGSHTINVVSHPDQAFQASYQFGKFTRLLSNFNADVLHATIPDFHNLTLRYEQFEQSLRHGNAERIRESAGAIKEIKEHTSIVESFQRIQKNRSIPRRVTHHDTKISNVLFDDQGKGLCVIDLDTVMPGYFFSDVGDMMRTYLSPANEEEKDLDRIEVRDEFFKAIVQGYLSKMRDGLSSDEKDLILYAGPFLIYMQAIRFLADHFNNDSYYGARYPGHNYVRATNQLRLLRELEAKDGIFKDIISKELKQPTHFIL